MYHKPKFLIFIYFFLAVRRSWAAGPPFAAAAAGPGGRDGPDPSQAVAARPRTGFYPASFGLTLGPTLLPLVAGYYGSFLSTPGPFPPRAWPFGHGSFRSIFFSDGPVVLNPFPPRGMRRVALSPLPKYYYYEVLLY